jgi:hypothetical protein
MKYLRDRADGMGAKGSGFCPRFKILPMEVARTSVVPSEPRSNVSSMYFRTLPNSYWV